jgi:hypothetical protein
MENQPFVFKNSNGDSIYFSLKTKIIDTLEIEGYYGLREYLKDTLYSNLANFQKGEILFSLFENMRIKFKKLRIGIGFYDFEKSGSYQILSLDVEKEPISTLVIGNKVFHDVFVEFREKEIVSEIYLTKEDGLVAFKLLNDLFIKQ